MAFTDCTGLLHGVREVEGDLGLEGCLPFTKGKLGGMRLQGVNKVVKGVPLGAGGGIHGWEGDNDGAGGVVAGAEGDLFPGGGHVGVVSFRRS